MASERVDVAPSVHGAGKDVALELPDGVLRIVDCCDGVCQGPQRPVGDLDELGCLPRGLPRVGYDDGENVTEVRGTATFGDEHWPVGVDDSDTKVSGQVCGGEDAFDARHGECGRGVDLHHIGSRMVGEAKRPVQHARNADVVDVAAVTQCQLGALVAGTSCAEAPRQHGRRRLATGEHLYGVEDLGVAGAAAEMRAEEARPPRPG